MYKRQLLLAMVFWLAPLPCLSQQIHVSHAVPISPPESGWHNWTNIAADPNDSYNLIACGSKWIPQKNALAGFLYASFDGGRSWQSRIADESSRWVSEESCAFGPGSRAYFLAGVSRNVDGVAKHELGKMHFYFSEDAGRSWSDPLEQKGWKDFTSTVVDTTQGKYAGRVYVFYHKTETESEGFFHSEIRVVYSDDEGKTFKGSATRAAPAGVRYKGAYPTGSRVLQDGSAVAVFTTRREARSPAPPEQVSTEFVATSDGGNTLSVPVQVMSVTTGVACAGDPTIAVDESDGPSRGRIYIARPGIIGTSCQILLSSSSDGGKTWSKPAPVTMPNATSLGSGAVSNVRKTSLEVNKDGVIGLAWSNSDSNCWRFSASVDRGASFLPSVPLSPCNPNSPASLQFLNSFLWSVPFDDNVVQKRGESPLPAFSMRSGAGSCGRRIRLLHPMACFILCGWRIEKGEARYGQLALAWEASGARDR